MFLILIACVKGGRVSLAINSTNMACSLIPPFIFFILLRGHVLYSLVAQTDWHFSFLMQ